MAAKPETRFFNSINKLLPKSIYHMKNNNPYVGGVPDSWYSGHANDLWIEWKFLPTTPVRAIVDPKKLLSALQIQWLDGRHSEGRDVAVVIGCPDGAVILVNKEWHNELNAQGFRNHLLTKKQIAEWITTKVNE